MRPSRVYLAGVVLGATWVAAVWLYTYRAWETVETFDPRGELVVSTRVNAQPWWSVYATIAVTLIGAGLSVWLLPQGGRLIRQFVTRLKTAFAKPPPRRA